MTLLPKWSTIWGFDHWRFPYNSLHPVHEVTGCSALMKHIEYCKNTRQILLSNPISHPSMQKQKSHSTAETYAADYPQVFTQRFFPPSQEVITHLFSNTKVMETPQKESFLSGSWMTSMILRWDSSATNQLPVGTNWKISTNMTNH